MGNFVAMLLIPIVIQHVSIKGLRSDYHSRNVFAMGFFFSMLTALVMLRHETVGNDTATYVYYFNEFVVMDWYMVVRTNLEVGFSIYTKIITIFTQNPQIYLAITALLITLMMYPTYKRLCLDTALTAVLFCFLSTFVVLFSGLRQMLSVGIGFLAYEQTRKRNPLSFLILVALAISFHTSAFMLIFMYPMYHVKITKNWFYIYVPVLVICFVFNRQIFSVLTLILSQFTKYEGGITSTGAYATLILFALLVLFSYIIPDERLLDKETFGLRNFLLLSLGIQLFAPLHLLAMRMNYYYIIFIPLLIPKIIECRNVRWNQVAIAGRYVMFIFFFFYFIYSASTQDLLNVFPYHFFWEIV